MNVLEGLLDFDAPGHPSTPFGDGVLGYDILRLVILVCALVLVLLSVLSIWSTDNPGQRLRMAATMCFVVSIAGTEVSHLGDQAHWRLFVHFAATALASWGLFLYLRYESPGSGDRLAVRDERRRLRHSGND